jgi:hypothetical protein
VGRTGYEFVTESISGKEMKTEELLTAMRESYDDILSSLMEPLEAVPFTDVKALKEAAKKFLVAFPEEEKQIRDFFDECFSYTVKMMNENFMIKDFISSHSCLHRYIRLQTSGFHMIANVPFANRHKSKICAMAKNRRFLST